MTSASEYEQQLIRKIENGQAYFDEDEVDRYSDEVLIAFAHQRQNFIEYLPKSRLSYAVLKAVIDHDQFGNALKYVSSKDTPHYKQICILAVANGWTQLKHVEPEYVNAEFYRKTIAQNPKAIYGFLLRYASLLEQLIKPQELEDLLNTGIFNRTAIIGGVLKGKIKTQLIRDSYIKELLLFAPHQLAEALKTEFKPLALEMVADGAWPEEFVDQKPSSLKDSVKALKAAGNTSVTAWHKAYIMNFGIEKAVNAMKAPGKLELLETIYTREEIKRHLKGHYGNEAKGKWLDEEMGL